MKKEIEKKKEPLEPEIEIEIPANPPKVKLKVKLKAPKQKDNKTVYYSVEDPVNVDLLPDPDGFNPCRFVINILVDKNPNVEEDLFSQPNPDPLVPDVFDPAVRLTVVVTEADIQYAGGKMIRLALHDGKKWVVKVANIDKAGPHTFELKKLGDPAIAISP